MPTRGSGPATSIHWVWTVCMLAAAGEVSGTKSIRQTMSTCACCPTRSWSMSLRYHCPSACFASRTRAALNDRLLLADGELGIAVDDPDRVVQMQHVHAGHCAVGVDQLGIEAGDVAGLVREQVRRIQPDDVLAGLDDRRNAVRDVLDPLVVDVRDLVRLVRDRWALGPRGSGVRRRVGRVWVRGTRARSQNQEPGHGKDESRSGTPQYASLPCGHRHPEKSNR